MIRINVVLIVLFSLQGCTTKDSEPSTVPSVQIAAWIGTKQIEKDEMMIRLKVFMIDRGLEPPASMEELNETILDCLNDMAQEIVLMEETHKRGITRNDLGMNPELLYFKRDDLPESFASLKEDYQKWEERVIDRFLMLETSARIAEELSQDIIISDEQIQAFYDTELGRWIYPAELEVRVIRVYDQNLIWDISNKIKNGWSFEKLADNYSNIRGQGVKGEPFRFTVSELPAEFYQELEKLKPKEITPVLTGYDGFYIYKLEKRYPERTLSLDEVRENIREELFSRESTRLFREWLDERVSRLPIVLGTPIPFSGERP